MIQAGQIAVTGRPIILYDGVCGFCNRIVQLLLRIERADQFLFVPLESPLAVELLAHFPASPTEPEGVILITRASTEDAQVFRRFHAVSEALHLIGGWYSMLGRLLSLTPKFLQEQAYRLIARNRYRLFGKYDTCPVPTQAQRSRILGM